MEKPGQRVAARAGALELGARAPPQARRSQVSSGSESVRTATSRTTRRAAGFKGVAPTAFECVPQSVQLDGQPVVCFGPITPCVRRTAVWRARVLLQERRELFQQRLLVLLIARQQRAAHTKRLPVRGGMLHLRGRVGLAQV